MSGSTTLVWLRRDLRLHDHPALRAACEGGGPVLPVFAWTPDEERAWSPGAASRWWLHHSLIALDASLRALGSRLIVRRGATAAGVLLDVARQSGARALVFQRRHEPALRRQEESVVAALRETGLRCDGFGGALLLQPGEIRTATGDPYKVFTPFWRALSSGPRLPEPAPAAGAPAAPSRWPSSTPIGELGLLPGVAWDAGIREAWTPGEAAARSRLAEFLDGGAHREYARLRDEPGQDATSRLSPHLAWGEVSPLEAWHAAGGRADDAWLRQLAWREFSAHCLARWPDVPDEPLRASFRKFPWRRDARALRAWRQGRTGYPMVDAGMRELWTTGWMHGRARMIVASFLVKHLLLPWQDGERWFWDTLVDADLANNALSWQWVAGCGLDAAPFFRIFNPVSQGEKLDAGGAYVRRWIPEIAALPDRFVHAPWTAPPLVLAEAGVRLGSTYPHPIVDHAEARARALDALSRISGR